jgi:hypothetical protein
MAHSRRASVPATLLLSCAAAAQVRSAPAPIVCIENFAPIDLERWWRVSFPFPRGTQTGELDGLRIGDAAAHVLPLVRWPDRSVAVAQLQFRARLPAGAKRAWPVTWGTAAAEPVELPPPRMPAPLPLFTETEDAWGRVYRARPRLDWGTGRRSLPVDTLSGSDPHVDEAMNRFLGLRWYLTTFAGEGRAVLTLLLDNESTAPGPQPLGPTRLRAFRLITTDPRLRVLPRFRQENMLRPPEATDSGFRHALLGPSDHLYLGDRTAKAFRFDLVWVVGGAD